MGLGVWNSGAPHLLLYLSEAPVDVSRIVFHQYTASVYCLEMRGAGHFPHSRATETERATSRGLWIRDKRPMFQPSPFICCVMSQATEL